MVPFAKTGGLADVIGALPDEIHRLGHEAAVFIPRYKSLNLERGGFHSEIDRLEVPLGSDQETGRIFKCVLPSGLVVYAVDHPEFFCRDGIYGTVLGDYPDNDRRFIFFQRALLESLKLLGFKPDVIHCHDWQTGLIPVYIKTFYANDSFFQKTKTVFTIHNLGYQGNFPPDSLPATNLSWDQFRIERLEFYGKFSSMKGGILDADAVTTVSERYAREIQSKEFGCGLEGVLSKRHSTISGILNGIDHEEWDPEKDPDIASPYGLKKLDGKALNKSALQKENDLAPDPRAPLIGMVSRLTDQKGIDILIPAITTLLRRGAQFVLLGTGEERYHQVFREFAKKHKGVCAVHILFDAKMAKRIYAGCDMMFWPSYYEPCGLGQLIALRYGTIPVVRATGGLADTVKDFDPKSGEGNGFSFLEYTSDAFLEAADRAIGIYRNPEKWQRVIQNAMESDYSWTVSAKKYVALYEKTKRRMVENLES